MIDDLAPTDPVPSDLTAAMVAQLVAARRAAGLSQDQVARRMGGYQPFVSKIENGLTSPRLSTVESYARAIGARVVWRVELATNEPGDVPGPREGE